MNRLAVVTATIDYPRAEACLRSWLDRANQGLDLYIVWQTAGEREWERIDPHEIATRQVIDINKPIGPRYIKYGLRKREILGVVPAFDLGVAKALADGHQIIACFHDDLEIEQDGWDEDVVRLFKACPKAGLVGFGGAKGLADDDIYRKPYNPMQLARKRFGSNMRHAEAHGERWTTPCPIAVLDGFSQIGLRRYWQGEARSSVTPELVEVSRAVHTLAGEWGEAPAGAVRRDNLFTILNVLGMKHHAYDAALGCFAAAQGFQVWFLPVAVHHHGGLTAVADPRYHEWANAYQFTSLDFGSGKVEDARGDQAFWLKAHRLVYDLFRHVLPIRVP